jgi:hypothetical protein
MPVLACSHSGCDDFSTVAMIYVGIDDGFMRIPECKFIANERDSSQPGSATISSRPLGYVGK